MGKQPDRKQPHADPTTQASNAAVSANEVATEICLGPSFLAQPFLRPTHLVDRLHYFKAILVPGLKFSLTVFARYN